MAYAGEILPVTFKLFDTNNAVFVKATVKTDAGVGLSGSPANLPNVGNGRYQTSSFRMPSGVNYVTVDYQVFNDSGFNTPSTVYANGTDQFALQLPQNFIAQMIIGLIGNFSTKKCHTCCPTSSFEIIQNSDVDLIIRFITKPFSEPLDLTPYSLSSGGNIRANFVNQDGSILQLTLTAGNITELNIAGGSIKLHLTAAQTLLLGQSESASFEIEFIENFGLTNQLITVVQFLNCVQVAPRIS